MKAMKPDQSPSDQPPRSLTSFVRWLVAPHQREEILGDLQERYAQRVRTQGASRARRRYWLEAFAYIRPAFIKRQKKKYPTTAEPSAPLFHPAMFRNHFKIAFRNLAKSKGYTFINIAGLAAGMACTVLIFMVVKHEMGYDKSVSNGNRIYRVETENIKEKLTYPGTYTGMAQALRTDFPEAELVTPMLQTYGSTLAVPAADKRFRESVIFMDSTIFDLLDYQWISGNAEQALAQPNTVVLAKSYALKFFGTADVIGKIIRIDNKQDLSITGVLEDQPVTTSFPFKVLVSFSTLKTLQPDLDLNRWNGWNDNFQVFVLLKNGVLPKTLTKRFTSIVAKYIGKEALSEKKFKLNPLSEIHYSANLGGRTANVPLLKTLSFIGLLVLIIACFNFINLSTAQAFKRAREVGIRKAIGSNRQSLIFQFMAEAALVTFFALLLAGLISLLSMQFVADTLAIPLSIADLFNLQTLLFMAGLSILTTLLAGAYPAFRMSGMSPIWAMKKTVIVQSKHRFSTRQGLVVAQFTVSLILVSSAFLINRQLTFFKDADLGFNKSAIVTVGLPDNKPENLQALRNRLTAVAQIQDLSFSLNSVSSESNWMQGMEYRVGPSVTQIKTQMKMGDSHYLDTYGVQLLAGNALQDSDTANFKVLANEVFINRLGITRPQDAIGVMIYYGDSQQSATIVGVVKNFHVNSLHQKIDPTVVQVVPNNFHQAGIKLKGLQPDGENVKAALKQIEKAWTAIFPGHVFEYGFLDEALAQAYQSETRTAKLIEASTFLAVLIACLGLFGLATFTAEQRTKEIGVRKVLGASVANITALLSKDFLKLILVAIVIASPIAWYAMNQWLQNFEFKIEIKWWMFAVTGLLMTMIAMLTVSFQSIKAALLNPVKSLRSE
jgi:putative ABC transport system permease protein